MATFHSDNAGEPEPVRLTHADRLPLEEFLRGKLEVNLFALSWLQNHGVENSDHQNFAFWACRDHQRKIQAVALNLSERLLLLDARTTRSARILGHFFRDRGQRFLHIVGVSTGVSPFWQAYSHAGPDPPQARLIQHQKLFTLRPEQLRSRARPATGLRRAEISELDAVFLASARMHLEETLEDPLERNAEAFRRHVRFRITHGRSFVWFDDRQRLKFKADLSSRSAWGVQLSGVYTAPSFRGRGVATAALSDLAALLFDEGVPLITLYVNETNAPAIRVYRRLGFVFRRHYQTIFLAD